MNKSMNKYDEYFDFRIATVADIDAIMAFIKKEWSADHILANNKEFFRWQYGNEQFGDMETINVVLMLDKKGNIAGMNGFIPYSTEPDERCVSSAITKVRPDLELPLCGVELIKRFRQLVPAKAYYSSGTNQRTMVPIGKKVFHYETGIMQQYYMLNDNVGKYEIAHIKHSVPTQYQPSEMLLIPFDNLMDPKITYDFDKKYDYQGYKSKAYVDKRYFNHPAYKYLIFGVRLAAESTDLALLIGREIQINCRKILRIVDFIGDIVCIEMLGTALHQLMYKNDYEYIDMMVGSLSPERMRSAGFTLRGLEDENIIPTYFEPFVQENVNVWYQKSNPDIIIFKADGDQDRPNKITS